MDKGGNLETEKLVKWLFQNASTFHYPFLIMVHQGRRAVLFSPKLTTPPVLSFPELCTWPFLPPSSPGSPSLLALPLMVLSFQGFYIHVKPHRILPFLLCSEISFPFPFKLLKTQFTCLIPLLYHSPRVLSSVLCNNSYPLSLKIHEHWKSQWSWMSTRIEFLEAEFESFCLRSCATPGEVIYWAPIPHFWTVVQ